MRFIALSIVMHALGAFPFAVCASSAEQDMSDRSQWQAKQKVIRVEALATVHRLGAAKKILVRWERTPEAKHQIILSDPVSQKVIAKFLQQEGVSMVLTPDEDVGFPVAPWSAASLLLGNALEPATALDWATGIPGKNSSVEPSVASVQFDDNRLTIIKQDGWIVRYVAWSVPEASKPSIPMRFIMESAGAMVDVVITGMEVFSSPPEGYKEFQIR